MVIQWLPARARNRSSALHYGTGGVTHPGLRQAFELVPTLHRKLWFPPRQNHTRCFPRLLGLRLRPSQSCREGWDKGRSCSGGNHALSACRISHTTCALRRLRLFRSCSRLCTTVLVHTGAYTCKAPRMSPHPSPCTSHSPHECRPDAACSDHAALACVLSSPSASGPYHSRQQHCVQK